MDKMKKLFSYEHEYLKTKVWSSLICRNESGFYHESTLGIIASKAFRYLNSEFNSESWFFPSAKKAFQYFLKFNSFWSDPRNNLIHLTNDLSISNSRRWENISKTVFIDNSDTNHTGYQLDIAIIFTYLKDKIIEENPDGIKKITKPKFERLLETINNPKAFDSYLDIYYDLNKKEVEFWQIIEEDFSLGIIRNSIDQTLQLMIILPQE